jgi:hypothetical protein
MVTQLLRDVQEPIAPGDEFKVRLWRSQIQLRINRNPTLSFGSTQPERAKCR